MKNIHLIPTDKPSRLWLSTRRENCLIFDKFPRVGVEYVEPQNIYITYDEEIKDCWVLNIHTNEVYFLKGYYGIQPIAKKVILTTDQDLINDGVQSINDEFLEWFVKNSSCEEVEVESGLFFYAEGEDRRYKIIIPKEESTLADKLRDYLNNTSEEEIQKAWDETCKKTEGVDSPTVEEFLEVQRQLSKQETLEEAAARHFNKEDLVEGVNIQYVLQYAFVQGAKWQMDKQEGFIERATSKYVEKQKLEFAIEQLKNQRDSADILNATEMYENLDTHIGELEQQLKQLENGTTNS